MSERPADRVLSGHAHAPERKGDGRGENGVPDWDEWLARKAALRER